MLILWIGASVFQAMAQVGPPPVILSQPADQTVQYKEDATFSVSCSSVTAVSYQWLFQGQELDKETQPTLTIKKAKPKDMGLYSVRIRNAAGTVTSSSANLVVQARVHLTSARKTEQGFELLAEAPPQADYIIEASSNFRDWTPIFTNSTPDGALSFLDTNSLSHATRVYRVRVD